jgi:uncharacterized NAD-dependent epimerase/dehydratase family protein
MDIAKPYLIFLGDAHDDLAAKTGQGIVDWRADWCVGQFRLPHCKADTGLADISIAQAKAKGAKTMIVGVANAGGFIPEHWVAPIVEAIEAGMDIASGLHARLADIPAIALAAAKAGASLHDVRHSSEKFATGTDCSVGKKYTALALEKAMRGRGYDADFRATGQTGIFISGRGVAVDAVVADFISGAAEWLSPANTPTHWDLVEGQGSLFHPSFAGVTLGLLHGAQPDAFVVCHEPTRTHMRGVQHALPTIGQVIEETVRAGRLTNPSIRCVGLAINTEKLDDEAAREFCRKEALYYDLPATDPVRFGVEGIVSRIVKEFGAP